MVHSSYTYTHNSGGVSLVLVFPNIWEYLERKSRHKLWVCIAKMTIPFPSMVRWSQRYFKKMSSIFFYNVFEPIRLSPKGRGGRFSPKSDFGIIVSYKNAPQATRMTRLPPEIIFFSLRNLQNEKH